MKKFNKKFILLGAAIFVMMLPMFSLMTSCSIEGLNEPTIINLLFPNVWVFVGQLISMAILFVVILFFIWKPTNKMLSRRQALINAEIEEASELKNQAQLELEKSNFILEESKEKANQIILDAENKASELRIRLEEEAKLEHAKIISSGHETIELEIKKIHKQAEQEIVDTAIKAAELLIQKQIDKKQNEKIIKEFIESLE